MISFITAELQEQVQQALAEQRSYVSDLSDAHQPSVRDLHGNLKSTGIYERGNLPGGSMRWPNPLSDSP